jgi:malate/lactate dehydrogenase
VTILGAAGAVGQPLAMLLKRNPTHLLTHLSLYDEDPSLRGIAMDVQQIQPPPPPPSPSSTRSNSTPHHYLPVESFVGRDELPNALFNADIVISTTHSPRPTQSTPIEWFGQNAATQIRLAQSFAQHSPNAIALISSPVWVNSFTPLWGQCLKEEGVFNADKLIGLATINNFRSNAFISNHFKKPYKIPVIGGTYKSTAVPIFSLINGLGVNQNSLDPIEIQGEFRKALLHRIMFSDSDINTLKDPDQTGANLSQAMSISHFVDSCLYGLTGQLVTNEIAYVYSPEAMKAFSVPYFSSGVVLGPTGIHSIHHTWIRANEFESNLLRSMTPTLRHDIRVGENFVSNIYHPVKEKKNHTVGLSGIDYAPDKTDEQLREEFQDFHKMGKMLEKEKLDEDVARTTGKPRKTSKASVRFGTDHLNEYEPKPEDFESESENEQEKRERANATSAALDKIFSNTDNYVPGGGGDDDDDDDDGYQQSSQKQNRNTYDSDFSEDEPHQPRQPKGAFKTAEEQEKAYLDIGGMTRQEYYDEITRPLASADLQWGGKSILDIDDLPDFVRGRDGKMIDLREEPTDYDDDNVDPDGPIDLARAIREDKAREKLNFAQKQYESYKAPKTRSMYKKPFEQMGNQKW